MPNSLVGTAIKVYRNGGFKMGVVVNVAEDGNTIWVTRTTYPKKGAHDEFIKNEYGIYFKKGSYITYIMIKEEE